MKIPLTFVTEKNLDQKIEALLQESESVHGYNTLAVGSLAAYSKEFLKGKVEDYDSNYKKALRLTKGLNYTLKDVEELSKRIWPGEDETLGIYLSAVINRKIRKKDEVVLSPNGLLTGLGMYLRKGTVIVEGDTRNATGRCMKGGKVIVKGSVRNDTGESMEDGEIIVKGDAKNYTGFRMYEGKITIGGCANDYTGCGMKSGEMIVLGDSNYYTGYRMRRGKLTVYGSTNKSTGEWMEGGKLIVKGKIRGLGRHIIKGTIIQGNKTVVKRLSCLFLKTGFPKGLNICCYSKVVNNRRYNKMEKIRIFHSADPHGDIEAIKTYSEHIKKEKPDMAFIAGDLIDGVFTESQLEAYAKDMLQYKNEKEKLITVVIKEAKIKGEEEINKIFPLALLPAIAEEELEDESIIEQPNKPKGNFLSTKKLYEISNDPQPPIEIRSAITQYLNAREALQKHAKIAKEGMESQYRDIDSILEDTNCLIIPGNHDGKCLEGILLEKYIHKQGRTIKDIKIAGYGSSNARPAHIPGELLEDFPFCKIGNRTTKEVVYQGSEAGWFLIEKEPDIAVVHTPPMADEGIGVYFANEKPYLLLAGHIHQLIGVQKIGQNSHLVMPGKLGYHKGTEGFEELKTFAEIHLEKEGTENIALQPEKILYHQIKDGKIKPFMEYTLKDGVPAEKKYLSEDCSLLRGWM